jgi:hypothetical protein
LLPRVGHVRFNEDTVVTRIWPAGKAPDRLRDLTWDTKPGRTLVELRVAGDVTTDVIEALNQLD